VAGVKNGANLPPVSSLPVFSKMEAMAIGRTFIGMKYLKAVNKYLWKYRLRFGAGIVFIIISNYFAVLAPQVTGYVVDRVQQSLQGRESIPLMPQKDLLMRSFVDWMAHREWDFGEMVALCGVVILLLALLRGIFMYFMRQTIVVMSRLIEFDQKNEVYRHYQTLDTNFFRSNTVGDMMNRISEDVGKVRMYTGPAIMYLVNLVTIIVLAVGNMLAKNVTLTLYVLAPLPILAFAIYYVNTIIHRKSEELQGLLSDLTTNAQQSYSGIRVIKSYLQEKTMMGFFDENSEAYRRKAIGLAKVEAIYAPAIVLIIGVSTLITIMMGGVYYLRGDIAEVGIIVEFVLYINMLTFPVSAVGWVASMIQRASASQKRLNEFLETNPAIQSSPGAQKGLKLKGHIVFDRVNFTYPHTGIHAIREFSLEINPGEKIAIVGRTGSGKSTLSQLLLRMYDINSGNLLLDGEPLTNLDLQALRKQISYVPQDVFLFSDTVSGNIRFGNAGATDEQVVQAAKQAAIHHEIEHFENGYQTLVGERGVTLSGGQKQRISIARALLKEAPILILDDCLSAVDSQTERRILGHLATHMQHITTIIITHRIFTHLQFDQIIVMEDGKIIEKGTHESLLALNGEYAWMYNMQKNPTGTAEPEEVE
jgi:ATP-binding cassette subfamily B protein